MKTFIKYLILRYDLYDADVVCFKHGKIVEKHTLYHPQALYTYSSDVLVRIASISKLFVAIAIMQLKEKGIIDLDDAIDTYYPYAIRNSYFPNIPITIRMILTHTSSFQDTETLSVPYGESLSEIFSSNGKYYSDLMFLKANGHPVKPGTMYHYYNTGFQLLAGIIEMISHERFDLYIKTHILNPLSMKGSFNPSDPDLRISLKPTFRKSQNSWIPQTDSEPKALNYQDYVLGTNGSLFSPQGGLRTNASELSHFMQFLMTGNDKILSNHSIQDMIRVHFPVGMNQTDDDFSRNNGLGFNVITQGYFNRPIVDMPYSLVGHCGIAYGCLGVFFFDPMTQNGLIFITRGHGKPIEDYAGKHSSYFNFQEEMFTYVDQHIWRSS